MLNTGESKYLNTILLDSLIQLYVNRVVFLLTTEYVKKNYDNHVKCLLNVIYLTLKL